MVSVHAELRNAVGKWLISVFPSPLFVGSVEPRELIEQRLIDTSCHELGYWVNELLPRKKYTARPLNQFQ